MSCAAGTARSDLALTVSICHPFYCWEVGYLVVNVRESVSNLMRKMRIFRDCRGNTDLVEFSLVLPMFLLLMFGLIDLGRYYWIRETVENAVRQAGRYAVTGQSMTGDTRVQSITQVAQNAMVGLYNLNTTTITVSSSPVGQSPSSGTSGFAGYAGENVTIQIQTALGFFTPGIARYFGPTGSNTLVEAVTFRNESFPASQAH